jgi:D-alanine-D-alanine ligase
MNRKLRVAVLMGGTSAERPVSLSTGKQILNALDPDRYTVYALDTASGERFLPATGLPDHVRTLKSFDGERSVSTLADLQQVAESDRPDVVFIALHGPGGEDGTVQGMLELLGVPYVGSGVLASALAMDKAMCKRVLVSEGVLMPEGRLLRRGDDASRQAAQAMALPLVVKPNAQGSSFGVTIVETAEQLDQAIEKAFQYDSSILVEQCVRGTEISVPVLGNDVPSVLPIIEIVPKSGVYDYESKYTPGATDEIVPARLADGVTARAQEIAATCHKVLGCRGMSRTDMIVTASGEIYALEVNTIPGMTPTSLLPRSAQAAGIPFPELLDRLIGHALEGR